MGIEIVVGLVIVHAILVLASVTVLHAQLKAYSEMTKNQHLQKMSDKV